MDSDVSIQTQGLLGGKYVGIGPGGSETFLKEGSQFTVTQSALVLETLITNSFPARPASRRMMRPVPAAAPARRQPKKGDREMKTMLRMKITRVALAMVLLSSLGGAMAGAATAPAAAPAAAVNHPGPHAADPGCRIRDSQGTGCQPRRLSQ